MGFPQTLWQGSHMLGEVAAADGTRPLRCLLKCAVRPSDRTWIKRAGCNTHESYAFGLVSILGMELHAVGLCPMGQESRGRGQPS